jgi:RNA polymerase sigma-70 factor (ECF subfamily)
MMTAICLTPAMPAAAVRPGRHSAPNTPPAADPVKGPTRPIRLVAQREAPASAKPVPTDLDAPPHAFQRALVDTMPQLRRYALSLCKDPNFAEDLVQETMLNAWLARHRFQAGTNLKAWCATILRNVFYSHTRRSWRTLAMSDEMLDTLTAVDTGGSDALDLLAARNVLSLLADDQREALLLVGVGGFSYQDAADICGCASGTIKSRVSRARLRAAVLLNENKAGLNSDPSMSAQGALEDLLNQVERIVSQAVRSWKSQYKPSLPRKIATG